MWPFYGPETARANTQSSNGRVKNALFSCKNGTCVEGYDIELTSERMHCSVNFCSNYAIEAAGAHHIPRPLQCSHPPPPHPLPPMHACHIP